MNRKHRIATYALALAATLMAMPGAYAGKFPYRNIPVDKPPPLEAPDPGDVTLQQTPRARSVAPGLSDGAAADANTSRKGWDGSVKGDNIAEGRRRGGVITGSVVISNGSMLDKVVEPGGGGGCTDPRLGGRPKPGCPVPMTSRSDESGGPAGAGARSINESGVSYCKSCTGGVKK